MRGVVQIDAEIVGQHELDPAHHVLRARQLAHVDEAAAGGDGAPVDPARIERAGLLGPVGEDLQPLPGNHPRTAGGGIAGALADQIGRQVPIGVERGIADQPGHFGRRHGALADDDEHRVADPAVLDHPEPRRGGVDEDIAPVERGDRAGPLEIGEDQPLVIGGAAIQRGDGGAIGAPRDRKAVNLLEGAQRGGGVGAGGEPEALAELLGPVRGNLELRQAGPAGAVGGEAAHEAAIGRVAGQAGACERDRRGRGGEGIERSAVLGHHRGEAGIDVAHRIAPGRAGAVARRVEKGLAQHHVGAKAGAAVAGPDRVERGHHIGARRQQVEQGLVGAVGPDGLEVALGIEGEELGPGLEGGRVRPCRSRAPRRGLRRRAVGRDGPETDGEAGGAQEAARGRHGCQNRPRPLRGPTMGRRGQRLCRTGAGDRDSLSFAAPVDHGSAVTPDLAILYEHPEWFRPLFAALDRRGIAWEAIRLAGHSFDPADRRVPAPVVLSRVAMSSFLRDPEHGIFYAQSLLAHWRANGARVLNGPDVLAVDSSKARQLSLIAGLGLAIPETRAVHRREDILAAAGGMAFPLLLKANVGGSGAGIVRYDDRAALGEAVAERFLPESVDKVLLVQDYVPAEGGRIIRLETLGGRFLYAIEIDTGGSFDLCPADACVAGTPVRMAAVEPAPELVEAAERIAQAVGLDVGGIEVVIDARDGVPRFYDINALSNFVANPLDVLGWDPHERLVDFLEAAIAEAPNMESGA